MNESYPSASHEPITPEPRNNDKPKSEKKKDNASTDTPFRIFEDSSANKTTDESGEKGDFFSELRELLTKNDKAEAARSDSVAEEYTPELSGTDANSTHEEIILPSPDDTPFEHHPELPRESSPATIDDLTEAEQHDFITDAVQRFRGAGSHVTRIFEKEHALKDPENGDKRAGLEDSYESEQVNASQQGSQNERHGETPRDIPLPSLPHEAYGPARTEARTDSFVPPEREVEPEFGAPPPIPPEGNNSFLPFWEDDNHGPGGGDFDTSNTIQTSRIDDREGYSRPTIEQKRVQEKLQYKRDKQKFWRGFLAGGVVAGLWGRRKRRKIEKRLNKELDQQHRVNKSLQEEVNTLHGRMDSEQSAHPRYNSIRQTQERAYDKERDIGAINNRIPIDSNETIITQERIVAHQDTAHTNYAEFMSTSQIDANNNEKVFKHEAREQSEQKLEAPTYGKSEQHHERRSDTNRLVLTGNSAAHKNTRLKGHKVTNFGLRDTLVSLKPGQGFDEQKYTHLQGIKQTEKRVQTTTWIAYATTVGLLALLIFIFLS